MDADGGHATPHEGGGRDVPVPQADGASEAQEAPSFNGLRALHLNRDGSIHVVSADGREAHGHLGHGSFAPTSMIDTSTYFPATWGLQLRTVRGHRILVELPRPNDLAPIGGRPIIYLDQNHWSALAHAIHRPDRVRDADELSAAKHLIELGGNRAVVLPMSAGHISETCQQANVGERYERALTIAQLSAGWQLRDPLDLRRFELRQALTVRYRRLCLVPPAGVTLEPNAVHASRDVRTDIGSDLPPDARWILHALRCAGGTLDAMLDGEHVPANEVLGWASQFERFAKFLAEDPTGPELKRRRTHAKFIADLGRELPEEAHRAGVTPEQMSDWTLNHSETDLRGLPVLGLYREVLHEKLCNTTLRWKPNDLTDMMYLTAATGHCDYVVAERSHAAHLRSGLRRLGRPAKVYTSLREMLEELPTGIATDWEANGRYERLPIPTNHP